MRIRVIGKNMVSDKTFVTMSNILVDMVRSNSIGTPFLLNILKLKSEAKKLVKTTEEEMDIIVNHIINNMY